MSQATLPSTPYQNSNLFSNYYLDERVADLDAWDCDDEARAAFEELQDLWELEGDLLPSYKEDELLDSWIDEVLDTLGFGTMSETTLPESGGYNDRLLFESDDDRREGALRKKEGEPEAMYGTAAAVLEAKQWDADFSARFSEQRSYRDASHQIKYYLEHTPERMRWGVLTDGRKWRLYGTKDYATETYYEVDLPELLRSGSVEQFKYFFAFFRPAAFRETAGTCFLDTVWSESETAAQELGEDLQDNVFTALRVLGEGFVETNDLDIDPDDDAALEQLKEQSLVLLYRLMFVLYAESRGLIHPDDPDAVDEYEEHFSLDTLRLEVNDEIEGGGSLSDYSEHATSMWSRLEDLFRLVDSGEESLGIPPYNGGLFDDDNHEFLADNQVADRYVAEVIYRLGTTKADDGSFVLADYADLDTRHLGSIYEGLLEHEFRIAPEAYAAVAEDGGQVWEPATDVTVAEAVETVEAGELFVVNDDGERKATGAYYTPDYVVAYIVEETVDPLIDDIDSELRADGLEPGDPTYFGRFYRQVQELTILDPAMGSGHFLTKAVGYLTEQVMEVVREGEQGRDEQVIRRTLAKECIYGVDVNGMAVELAKLSMWLETLAADKPLAFLDHRLKAGNSLVGSDITNVLSDDSEIEGETVDQDDGIVQTTFSRFERARRRTLDHVMDLMKDLLAIDNEELEDIKSMEELYDKIRDDPLYQRLFELANVHTAEQFGADVPEGAYEEMAGAIEDADDWAEIESEPWFSEAQSVAGREDFFHWELEYPEVFFDDEGEKRDDSGFDAVVGNPPYVPTEQIAELQKEFLTERYETLYRKYDLSVAFLERSFELARTNAFTGMITPVAWETGENYSKFREKRLASGEASIEKIINLPFDVFEDAYVDTNIAIFQESGGNSGEFLAKEFEKRNRIRDVDALRDGFSRVPYEYLTNDKNSKIYTSSNYYELLQSYESERFSELGALTRSQQGIVASFFDYSDEKESEDFLSYKECDVYRYSLTVTEERFIDFSGNESQKEYYTQPRILLRRLVSRDDRLMAAVAEESFVVKKDLNPFIKDGTDLSLRYLFACLNSSLLSFLYVSTSALAQKDDFRQTTLSEVRSLPIRNLSISNEPDGTELEELQNRYESEEKSAFPRVNELIESSTGQRAIHDFVSFLTVKIEDATERKNRLNTNLLDYFGAYSTGDSLEEIGFVQPPENVAGSILQETTKQKPNLKVGEATVSRESDSTVEIRLTARYKPDPDKKGADAYTETDPLPALRITDLTETEADLIEAFVPVAVDEAGGFAGFRETATKTNSLVDRLRALTLPRVADVAEGLASYRETMARAEELEAKIERTDDLIDEIVYELYGLTDEEIEIVEDAVGE
ncbi:N-6 DNA methylase [Halosimplex rubrum]|uniref:site-specific DNA-methyltransferase (adenine-specific) n=1 Tax=Halosimplex rubrum TaxID=869889 RepID=A0A7D5PA36_9EURY|nr:TaqI-like C-terminal specificity domain-containing protein [Halosimplex rubrum]QLH77379.1 N-6 DNA methylase [Halosimplex rubrum]